MPCAITRLSVPVYRRPLFGVLYRTPPDWRQAVAELTGVALHVFKRVDFRRGGDQAEQALRILRCLVRGFVISKMAATVFCRAVRVSANLRPWDRIFILGLPALAAQ